MLYQIIWQSKAIHRFQQINLYLAENWGQTVTEDFKNQMKQVQINPTQFQRSLGKNIYEVLITKHNLLLYKIKSDEIVALLTIFDTRQNPKKKRQF